MNHTPQQNGNRLFLTYDHNRGVIHRSKKIEKINERFRSMAVFHPKAEGSSTQSEFYAVMFNNIIIKHPKFEHISNNDFNKVEVSFVDSFLGIETECCLSFWLDNLSSASTAYYLTRIFLENPDTTVSIEYDGYKTNIVCQEYNGAGNPAEFFFYQKDEKGKYPPKVNPKFDKELASRTYKQAANFIFGDGSKSANAAIKDITLPKADRTVLVQSNPKWREFWKAYSSKLVSELLILVEDYSRNYVEPTTDPKPPILPNAEANYTSERIAELEAIADNYKKEGDTEDLPF